MKIISLNKNQIKDVCLERMTKRGVRIEDANLLIDELILNEIDGYSSHGLVRLLDYCKDIENRIIDLNALPEIEFITQNSAIVNGNRSLGINSSKALVDTIIDILDKKNNIAIVGLKNSNHIGRLASVGRVVCNSGYAIIGFVNYLGAGQKVPAYGGSEGRFCTNPILVGIPNRDFPVVLDMTTSSVSEGKVRTYAINGIDTPEGWLIDKEWNTVKDATKLYDLPNDVFIKPLGGEHSYKGFGLALVTEIFAGILTGAGFVNHTSSLGGNGGLFIAFDLKILGLSEESILDNISELIDYIKSSSVANRFSSIRIPNETKNESNFNTLKISTEIWDSILKL